MNTGFAQMTEPRPQGNSMGPEPYLVPEDEVARHETGSHRAVRIDKTKIKNIFQAVKLTLIVDAEGNVVSATPVEGPSEAYAGAVGEAMTWKYEPFQKDGEPTVAKLSDYVRVLPPEDLPKTHEAFPKMSTLAGVTMTLSRSGCFGTCPQYSVEIHGDGTVIYKGESYVVVTGEHHDHVSADQVSEILEAFRKADYFSLKDEYKYLVTDCPTFGTSLKIDQLEKSVTDYVGEEAGMPESVTDLEIAIDRVANTRKWIKGNEDTVPSLKREGWNFKTAEAAEVLARASQEGNSKLVKALLAEGVALSGTADEDNSPLAAAAASGNRASVKMLIEAGAGKDDPSVKAEALGAAARSGDIELVRMLLEYGADPKLPINSREGPSTVLMWAATSGVPEIVETILATHPDVNARDERGHTAVWYISEANTYWDEKHHADRSRVVHLLAKAGADLNSQDEEGNVALHTAYGADVARALIEDGANVNIKNANSETPLMRNFSVEVAKLLVTAGADIHARNNDGKTALDLARDLEPNGERVRFLESVLKAEGKK